MQALAQLVGVLRGGTVLFRVEGDQNIAVGHAERGVIAEGQVEAAVRNADVVDDGIDLPRRDHFADLALDVGEDHLGLLQARAGRSARVQAHLAGIHRGEEIAADQRSQAKRCRDEEAERIRAPARDGPGTSAAAKRRRRASARTGG